MRKNQYDELMRIREIRLQPEKISNPLGDWNMEVLWQFHNEKSGEWYGAKTEKISMVDAVTKGFVTDEEVGHVYKILAKVADTFYLQYQDSLI